MIDDRMISDSRETGIPDAQGYSGKYRFGPVDKLIFQNEKYRPAAREGSGGLLNRRQGKTEFGAIALAG